MSLRALLVLTLGLFALPAAATQVFTGKSPSGAQWRIEAPDSWKAGDGLVLYQHGFSFDYGDVEPDMGPLRDLQLSEGYAVAASSFSQRGWAVFTAMDDNRDVLAAVQSHLGEPGEIIPFGGSLGGLLALKMAEDPLFRGKVKQVFSLCPAAAGSRLWDKALDIRLDYDVVCAGAGDLQHGAQPYPWAYNLNQIPNDLSDFTDELLLLPTLVPLNQCTGVNLSSSLRNDAMKRRLAALKTFSAADDDKFLVINVAYATYALSDLVRAPDKLDNRAGNGNIGVDYGDAATNTKIARVAADPMGALRLKWLSDFRGDVGAAKVLSLQTSRDQLVVPANQSVLRTRLPANQIVSALVAEDEPTHCGFNEAEGVAGWEALRAWSAGGAKPTVADLQTRCQAAVAADIDGPCRFDANIEVPPLDSAIHPRPAQTTTTIDARFNGNWGDPERNGEGIALEVLDGGNVVVYFFTYPPKSLFQSGSAQTVRDQAWMVGAGRIADGGIAVDDMRYFSPAGAPPGVQDAHWGRLFITFDDCNSGRLRWDSAVGWGSKDVPIQRLTSLKNLGCNVTTPTPSAQVSGSWYDPTRSGSGFHMEQLDDTHALVMYYAAPNGSSAVPGWYVGVAEGDLSVGVPSIPLVRPHGPYFGNDYDPGAVHNEQGSLFLTLRFGCNEGYANLTTLIDWDGVGTAMNLQRITKPAGVAPCN